MNLFCHIRSACSWTLSNARAPRKKKYKLNLPELKQNSESNSQPLPISCQIKLRTDEKLCWAPWMKLVETNVRLAYSASAINRVLSLGWKKNLSLALCARSGHARLRESQLETTFPLCTGSDKEKCERTELGKFCYQASEALRGQLWALMAATKLRNVVVVTFSIFRVFTSFYLIMNEMEFFVEIVTYGKFAEMSFLLELEEFRRWNELLMFQW